MEEGGNGSIGTSLMRGCDTEEGGSDSIGMSLVHGCDIDTGDKNPYTEPVYGNYMLVTCPEHQNFPESEYAKFFQNILNNITAISQPSIFLEYSKSTDPLRPQYPHRQVFSTF